MIIALISAANSTHTVKWANAFLSRGHEVHLIFNRDHCPESGSIDEGVVLHKLYHKGMKGYFFNVMQLKKIIKEIKPDIVNAHYVSGYGTLARLAKIKPLCLSAWGSDVYEFPYKSFIHMHIVKKNLRFASHLASTSKCMAEQIKKIMNNCSLDIEITPFGVDIEKFRPKRGIKKNNKIIIGNVKTLSPVYAIDRMILAVKLLMNQLRADDNNMDLQIEVDIYGDGPMKKELEDLIQKNELGDIVFLKGYIPNDKVPDVLSTMDIFCSTSIHESFGVAIVEAMAMELPVVVTNIDGYNEIVDDKITGFLVKKDSIEDIAVHLYKLIGDQSLRRQLGVAGRKVVENNYSWDNNVDKMLNFLEKCTISNKI